MRKAKNKRTKQDIVEKALCSKNEIELAKDGVWLPVSAEVYENVKKLLAGQKDFRLVVVPADRGKERALIITNVDARTLLTD
jgi:hypothetical protein